MRYETLTHVSLADAARVVARQDQTLLHWIAAGEFSDEEAVRLPARRGRGQAWRIALDALQRVNTAHGGYSWHPEAIREAAVPPELAQTLTRQEREIRALKAELEHLRGREVRVPQEANLLRVPVDIRRAHHAPAPTREEDWLPADWVTLAAWSRSHGLYHRSVRRCIADGRLPRPELRGKGHGWRERRPHPTVPGQWIAGPNEILAAYSPELHQQACLHAAILWPAAYLSIWCGPGCPEPARAKAGTIPLAEI